MPCLLLALFASLSFSAAGSPSCAWWYETTTHGSAFRNARDFGALGDGSTDDTAALLRALNENQTGATGSGLARSARVVYLPAGTYLIRVSLARPSRYNQRAGSPRTLTPNPKRRTNPNKAGHACPVVLDYAAGQPAARLRVHAAARALVAGL